MIAVASTFFGIRHIKKHSSPDINPVIAKIESVLPKRSVGMPEQRSNNAMPAFEVDGTDFVGLLEVPARNIKLPVCAKWNSAYWGFRPARYLGSAYDGTLIIGGKYEPDNFDFADLIDVGEKVTFTDMNGKVFEYKVDKVSHSSNAKTETLVSGEYPLTLFVKKESTFLIIRCILP